MSGGEPSSIKRSALRAAGNLSALMRRHCFVFSGVWLMVKKIIAGALLALVVLALSVGGGTPAPQRPWEVELEQYGRIFIMTPSFYPRHPDPDHMDWLLELEQVDAERLQIRSGLYYNTDPLVSIYYVDEYFHRLHLSTCGMYFVNIRWTTSPQLDTEALKFFYRGQQVSSYMARDVVGRWFVGGQTSAGVFWSPRQFVQPEQCGNTLTFRTANNRTVTLDIVTGEMTIRRPLMFTIIGTLVLIGIVIVVWRRRRS